MPALSIALLAHVLAAAAVVQPVAQPVAQPVTNSALADSAARLALRADSAERRRTEAGGRESIALSLSAATIFRTLDRRADESQRLHNVGRVYAFLGTLDSALGYDRQALAIRRVLRDRRGIGATLGALGNVHFALGQLDSAVAMYRDALTEQRASGNRQNEGATLSNIGRIYGVLGRPDSALRYYRQALAIQRADTNTVNLGRTLNNIGAVYASLGRSDSTLRYYEQARAVQRSAGDQLAEASTLGNIGSVLLGVQQPDSARRVFREALGLQRAVGDRGAVASTLANIGESFALRGQSDSALANFHSALALARSVGAPAVEGTALNNIGALYADHEQPDSALVYYTRALAVRRANANPRGEATTLRNLGRLYLERRANPARAVAYFDSAATVYGGLRGHAGTDANAISFAEDNRELFTLWTLAVLALGDSVDGGALASLAISDRGRAEALRTMMRGAVSTSPADPRAAGDSLLAPLRRSLTTALVYLATADTLVVWLAVPAEPVRVARVAVRRDSLWSVVRQLRGSVETDGRRATLDAARAQLAAWLIPDALRSHLPVGGDLAIVPHGALALVPFALLPLRTEPLGGRFAIRFAPSLASAASVATPAPSDSALRRALVVGNPTVASAPGAPVSPQLRGAEREARWIANRLGASALVANAATEPAVWARLASAPIAHFATHGVAYSGEARTRDSYVALAADSVSDGQLTVGELLDDPEFRLAADLVVLSACETGLGAVTDAEGVVGLARAFLAKGARSVVVSLWRVPDDATELLMRRLYAHWLGDADHPTKAESLRRAQGDVRRVPGFAHPRNWAAFQLIGAP